MCFKKTLSPSAVLCFSIFLWATSFPAFLYHLENCALQSSLPDRKAPLSSSIIKKHLWSDNDVAFPVSKHEHCRNEKKCHIYINWHTLFFWKLKESFVDKRPQNTQLYGTEVAFPRKVFTAPLLFFLFCQSQNWKCNRDLQR